jgi:predicted  nucleic acid-binding Zn-ribbon protein
MEDEMAGRFGSSNNLQEAMALLMQNQAALMQTQIAFLAQQTETRARMAQFEDEVRSEFAQIRAILLRHEQALADLPEAIRQKVGFKNR